MNIKHAFAAIAFTALLPFVASALTTEEIMAQIRSLLAQITQLQEQLKSLQTTPVGEGAPPSRVCPQILRTLSQGMSGADVRELQASLGVTQTGYFGPMTARAVSAFQAGEGLSRVGMVGPQTRAAFARRCGGSSTSDVRVLSPNGGESWAFGSRQTIRWYAPPGMDRASIRIGKYLPECYLGNQYICPPPPPVTPPTIAEDIPNTGSYTWTVGSPLAYGETLEESSYLISVWAWSSGVSSVSDSSDAPFRITGTSKNSSAPSISGLDAPTSLQVGQTGTWTVRAAAPSGTQLRYSVVWGDEGWGASTGSAQAAQANVQTSASFTHAYQNAGTYNPTFYVSNDYGTVQTSASVTVGNDTPPCCKTISSFTASPASGAAPLGVMFNANGAANSRYYIDFGDGTNEEMTPCLDCDGTSYGKFHTYQSPGTYVAKLSALSAGACASGYCATSQTVGTVTITVGSATPVKLSASPTSGSAPLSVSFYSPLSLDETVNAYTVDFGDGSTGKMYRNGTLCAAVLGNNCTGGKVAQMYTSGHSYTAPGTYTATLLKHAYACPEDLSYCPPPPPVWIEPTKVSTVTITVGGSAVAGTGKCVAWGCSSQNCGDESVVSDLLTTCEYRPVYACYWKARCERQTNGQCGWTQTPELQSCVTANGYAHHTYPSTSQ